MKDNKQNTHNKQWVGSACLAGHGLLISGIGLAVALYMVADRARISEANRPEPRFSR